MPIRFPKRPLDCGDIATALARHAFQGKRKQEIQRRIANLPKRWRQSAMARWNKLLREHAKKSGWKIIRFKKTQNMPTLEEFSLYLFKRGVPVQVPVLWVAIEEGTYAVTESGELHRIIPNIKDYAQEIRMKRKKRKPVVSRTKSGLYEGPRLVARSVSQEVMDRVINDMEEARIVLSAQSTAVAKRILGK